MSSVFHKTAFSKHELEMELNETSVDNLPEPLKSLRLSHSTGTHKNVKNGEVLRTNYKRQFNEYYESIKGSR